MNNIILRSGTAASATVAAAFFAGHAIQTESADPAKTARSLPPIIRFNQFAGSPLGAIAVSQVSASERSFEATLVDTCKRIASSQKSLDRDLVSAMVKSAWDMYDDA